jgi:hypothetical protein
MENSKLKNLCARAADALELACRDVHPEAPIMSFIAELRKAAQ